MNQAKCGTCKSVINEIYTKKENVNLDDFGYCTTCEKIVEVSKFFKRFKFEAYEKQDDKDSLEIEGHTLLWKSIGGQWQYFCTNCDQNLLESHNHLHQSPTKI